MSRQKDVQIKCAWCKKVAYKRTADISRAEKIGAPLYCGKKCFGLARRKENPISPRNPQWKELKAAYDRKRRGEKADELKAKKKAAYAVWGPKHRAEERKKRKANMPRHVEYCRQPEYRAYKKDYDRRKCLEAYGEFAEAVLVLEELNKEIKKQMPDRQERYAQSGRHQWNPINQQRRRDARKRGGNSL